MINGWIVKRGKELGVSCVTNYMMQELVNRKAKMIRHELLDSVPFLGAKRVPDGKGDNS